VGLFSYPTLVIIHCKQTVHSSLLYISKVEVIKKKKKKVIALCGRLFFYLGE
jgi:hypothetical protein